MGILMNIFAIFDAPHFDLLFSLNGITDTATPKQNSALVLLLNTQIFVRYEQ